MKGRELSGEERYRVVEMARKGEVPISEICETFGVSRQTLYRAMDKADRASVEALEPKRPGRRGKSEEEVKLEEAEARTAELEKKLAHWQMKYEVAKAYLDLERRYDRGEDLEGAEPARPKRGKKRKRPKRTRTRKRKK